MIKTSEYIKESKENRQKHLDLDQPCIERGGISTNHKGVLAEFLDTDIPYRLPLLLHACNNDKCSNPKHLYWGTYQENIIDAEIAGRRTNWKSQKGRFASFSEEKQTEIKKKISLAKKGVSLKKSNNPAGINGTSTGKISRGYTYTRKFKQKWITNGITNTRIPADQPIPSGFFPGMTVI